eukprot:1148493-Pelagomonas_calceolata.AAC.4
MHANKLVTTRHAIENNITSRSQVMEPGASSNPLDPQKHFYLTALWWRGLTALLSQCVSFSLIDVGRDPCAYGVYLFFLSENSKQHQGAVDPQPDGFLERGSQELQKLECPIIHHFGGISLKTGD